VPKTSSTLISGENRLTSTDQIALVCFVWSVLISPSNRTAGLRPRTCAAALGDGLAASSACVPKASSALISGENRLTSTDHDRTGLLRLERADLAVQIGRVLVGNSNPNVLMVQPA
jgi:hypothetical protein